jgi:formate hydrogenlyase subunit 6/NADH:ubiquinone oxidoreductase subunit I
MLRAAAKDTFEMTPSKHKQPVQALGTGRPHPAFRKRVCSRCSYRGLDDLDVFATEGIDLSLDPPILAKRCLNCEFYARLCPTGFLDMTPWLRAMEDLTVRFAHMMLDSPAEAEKGGRFRRADTAQ